MRQVAFIIGIEDYYDKSISSVSYAHNDVFTIKDFLIKVGILDNEIITLVSDQATKTVIDSRLRKTIKSLSDEDVFYFYYAGHGFSEKSKNYITCYDTQPNDWANTSVALQDILKLIKDSGVKKSIIFIDACESGLAFDPAARKMYSGMSDEELNKFLADAEGTICFSACKGNEESFSLTALKHGVWSYHLIQAFSGNAPESLVNGKIITPTSLQNYLSKEVPRTLRKYKSSSVTQTPWMCGAMSRDLLIADVGNILEERKRKKAPIANQLKKAIISSIHFENVKLLSGFKKGLHTVPKIANSTTQSFIERISENEISEIVESVHVGLRNELKYKRKDIMVSKNSGCASIITPHFDYHVEVEIDEDDPTRVIFHKFLDNISNGNTILSDGFDATFDHGFNSVDFIFQNNVDIETIVDALDDLDDPGFNYIPNADCTKLEIDIDEYRATIVIEPNKLSFKVIRPIAPKKLIPIIDEGLKQITGHKQLMTLPLLDDINE